LIFILYAYDIDMLNIDALKSAIRIEESDSDVFIYLGYIRLCAMYEDEGRWYPEINGREMLSIDGYESKEKALEVILKHLTD
jgi:hypothetical protein